MKAGLDLLKNVLKPLAKNILIPLGLLKAASAANAGIHETILGFEMTKFIVSNKEWKTS